jgi:hypothetical protein
VFTESNFQSFLCKSKVKYVLFYKLTQVGFNRILTLKENTLLNQIQKHFLSDMQYDSLKFEDNQEL